MMFFKAFNDTECGIGIEIVKLTKNMIVFN